MSEVKKAKGTRVVELTMMQRIALVRILPAKGETMLTVRAIVDLQNLLNMSGEEVHELGLDVTMGGNLQLTPEQQAATQALEIDGTAWTIIRDSITALEKAGTLPATQVMIDLWNIFMETSPVLVDDLEAESVDAAE